MSTDNVNRFEGFESENGGERKSYSRSSSWNGEGNRAPRQRFVRNADGTTRPQRPRFNREEETPRCAKVERPQRSSYNPNFEGNRPRFNRERNFDGERSYNNDRPYSSERTYNSERSYNGERTYSRNSSYNSDYSRRRFNDGDGNSYRPMNKPYSRSSYDRPEPGNSWNSDAENTFRPRYNREGGEGYAPRPRFSREGGEGYRPAAGGFKKKGAFADKKYSKKKQIQYREELRDPNEPIRLNKYLANAGVCSRREADDFITAGVVTVNGQVVNELGTKVKRGDEVRFHDQTISIERKIYILLNKPKDYVTTVEDPQDRKTVMELVKGACKERIYPVGRLDRNTTGVLLLTNDGELASKLTHPRFLKKKIYHVRLDKNLTAADMEQLATGIQLEDGEIHADEISYTSDTDKSLVGVEIHSGRNRIVRRMFEAIGYRVLRLDRVQFAGLTKKNVRRGDWRFLTEKEVNMLRMGAYE
ncbi:MAG: rRNA pseudouridine synthase [Bacteroidaceae bacterium]|nr:rRNA pseudouridine synthase [Bacteroidaceae bacterium]